MRLHRTSFEELLSVDSLRRTTWIFQHFCNNDPLYTMSDEVLKEEHMDTHDEEGNDEVVMSQFGRVYLQLAKRIVLGGNYCDEEESRRDGSRSRKT